MVQNVVDDYLQNLIETELEGLGQSENNFLLIKHYNTLDLSAEYIRSVSLKYENVTFLYHNFNPTDMFYAYEPFLGWIRSMLDEALPEMTLQEFLEKANVYQPHRKIFMSYFETGICERAEEPLIEEIEYEQEHFLTEITRMLYLVSLKKPIVIVLNKAHCAGSSTLKMLKKLFSNVMSRNIAIIMTFNENASRLEYTKPLWKQIISDYKKENSIVDWTLNNETLRSESNNNFRYNPMFLSEYYTRLNNMYYFMAFEQADYYMGLLYHKFEVEKTYVDLDYKFKFLYLYASAAMYQSRFSDALLYCNNMHSILETEKTLLRSYQYYFLAAQVHMLSFQGELAKRYINKCLDTCDKLDDPFLTFRAELVDHMIDYQGWRNVWILTNEHVPSSKLVKAAAHYEYYNHLAHMYVCGFDHDRENFSSVEKVKTSLPNFRRGVHIAQQIGNDRFVIEAYKINIMMASTNGYYDVSDYYHQKCLEVLEKHGNEAEEASILNGVGYNALTAEQYEKANDNFNHALELFMEYKDIEAVTETLYNMAVNAFVACDYMTSDTLLDLCQKIIELTRANSVRVANISKISGMRAYCNYKMNLLYNSKMHTLQVQQFLGHIIDLEAGNVDAPHLWDDDLVLYYLMSAIHLEHEGKLEEAYELLEKGEKYLQRSAGSRFMNEPIYVVSYARICRKLGLEKQATRMFDEAIAYLRERKNSHKAELLASERDGFSYKLPEYALGMKGTSIEEILDFASRIGLKKKYTEQRNELNFMSIWQKLMNSEDLSLQDTVDNAAMTLKNNYNIDNLILIRMEGGKPVLRYSDPIYPIDENKVSYLVNYFSQNRSDFITSRQDHGFQEYRNLMHDVFGFNSVNTLIGVPMFTNEQLNGIMLGCININMEWNYNSKRYKFDDTNLSVFAMLFRQLLDSMERIETQRQIQQMNETLQKTNERLKDLAIKDTLTGLFNRQGLTEELTTYVKKAQILGEDVPMALMYLDLDNFKYYNDTFGHDVGDMVLRAFSRLIYPIAKSRGFAVRYGGDEFFLILYSSDRREVEEAAKRVYSSLEEEKHFLPLIAEMLGYYPEVPEEKLVSCSIGICMGKIGSKDNLKDALEDTMKKADEKMYQVKKGTKHCYQFFE